MLLVNIGEPIWSQYDELSPWPPLFKKRGGRPTKEVGGEFISVTFKKIKIIDIPKIMNYPNFILQIFKTGRRKVFWL